MRAMLGGRSARGGLRRQQNPKGSAISEAMRDWVTNVGET